MARPAVPDGGVVDALCRGVPPSRKPSRWERLAAIRHLAGHGFTDPQVAFLVGYTARHVYRVRRAYGIEGQPRGTNGHTRVRSWPLESRNARK